MKTLFAEIYTYSVTGKILQHTTLRYKRHTIFGYKNNKIIRKLGLRKQVITE